MAQPREQAREQAINTAARSLRQLRRFCHLINADKVFSTHNMARQRRPPSQGWKTFLRNHADGIASIDLFVVPTISFRLPRTKAEYMIAPDQFVETLASSLE